MPNDGKMEIIECVNTMWGIFSRNISIREEKDIERFIEAKDRIHQLVSLMGEKKDD